MFRSMPGADRPAPTSTPPILGSLDLEGVGVPLLGEVVLHVVRPIDGPRERSVVLDVGPHARLELLEADSPQLPGVVVGRGQPLPILALLLPPPVRGEPPAIAVLHVPSKGELSPGHPRSPGVLGEDVDLPDPVVALLVSPLVAGGGGPAGRGPAPPAFGDGGLHLVGRPPGRRP